MKLAAQPGAPPMSGPNQLYGDLTVEGDEAGNTKTTSFTILLYHLSGTIITRQTVGANGRYRFNGLIDGDYDLVVEVENNEIARFRVQMRTSGMGMKTDHRQDINLQWKSVNARPRAPSVSAEDAYQRSSANQKLFDKAEQAANKKKYDEATTLLKQLVAQDPKDFQAWTELGTAYLVQENAQEAAQAYKEAIAVRPGFFLALMNLGRLLLLQKDAEAAVPVLSKAVDVKATSPEANYYLGEAYLQAKKGSKAVLYLNEALKLDPVGRADAHLRLATLYNAVGMKAKAAAEYEEFLKKKPEYPDRKRLEQYIVANKAAAETRKN
jgi:cytochrome c-type biogenesis protein CcmH/NrfG